MKVNMKSALLLLLTLSASVLAACEPLLVLDPKGPQAEVQANDIMISIYIMSGIVITVVVLLIFMLVKYRSSKMPADYVAPRIKGNHLVEAVCIGVPVIIVIVLSVMSVKSNYKVETTPEGYNADEALVIYASSSNWKWHFSYPEEQIETVNYVRLPKDRAVEFKLYSYGPITSFWIPQLGGQKYAMADMVTTLHLAAEVEGEYFGRNANFSGAGFAENTFDVEVLTAEEYVEWVEEVQATEQPITEEIFNELLKPGHLGRSTYTGTHLEFSPAPVHNHGKSGEINEEDNHEEGHSH